MWELLIRRFLERGICVYYTQNLTHTHTQYTQTNQQITLCSHHSSYYHVIITVKITKQGQRRGKKSRNQLLSSKPATRRWLLHYAFTCHRLTHVSGPLDRSSVFHIADMWLEAVGCLVGTEAAGGTPPCCLRLISAAHTHTKREGERHCRMPASPTAMNPGPYVRTGCLYPLKERLLCILQCGLSDVLFCTCAK